jgi:hypothetical protein
LKKIEMDQNESKRIEMDRNTVDRNELASHRNGWRAVEIETHRQGTP